MIADTLRQLNDQGALTAQDLEDLLGIARSSAYRYYGETDLRFTQYRTLVRQSRSVDAQAELLGALLTGTPWMATYLPADLDYDGDGDVDTDDAIRCAIDHLGAYTAMLEEVYTTSTTARIGDEQMDKLRGAYDHVLRGLVLTMRIIADQHRRQRRRRQARPVTVGGAS